VKLPIPKGRRAILVLGLPLGLAAAGAFVFMQMSSSGSSAPPKVPEPSAGEVGVVLALDSRVINLTTTAGGFKLAKISVSIELRPESKSFYALHGEARTKAETEALAKYDEQVPLLLDALGSDVSSHDSASLSTADGRAKLKSELLETFRGILGEEEVLDVYFTDFLMQ
jgi:flagellar basal body-associated protein FliL